MNHLIVSSIIAGLSFWSCYKKAKQHRTKVWLYIESEDDFRIGVFAGSTTYAAVSLILWLISMNF